MLRNILLGAGGVGAAGFGGYYMVQATEVSKFDKEQKDLEKLVDTEQKRAEGSRKGVVEAEATIKSLNARSEKQRQSVEDAQSTLDAARRTVSEAEAALQTKQAELTKVHADLASTAARIGQLRSEQERAREAVTLGEKSLGLAKQQAADSRLRLNPLNHPKVKSFLSGGGKK